MINWALFVEHEPSRCRVQGTRHRVVIIVYIAPLHNLAIKVQSEAISDLLSCLPEVLDRAAEKMILIGACTGVDSSASARAEILFRLLLPSPIRSSSPLSRLLDKKQGARLCVLDLLYQDS